MLCRLQVKALALAQRALLYACAALCVARACRALGGVLDRARWDQATGTALQAMCMLRQSSHWQGRLGFRLCQAADL